MVQKAVYFTNDQIWYQSSAGIEDTSKRSIVSELVSAGDFNKDGYTDLAIGVPGEELQYGECRLVNIIYGSTSGLNATNDQIWYQSSDGIEIHQKLTMFRKLV